MRDRLEFAALVGLCYIFAGPVIGAMWVAKKLGLIAEDW